jgi:hypothetical protein
MPIIGDTQIQPVNFLEQYMRGQEFARGRRVNEQADQLNALKLQAAEREQSNAMLLQQALAGGADDETLMRTPGGMSVLEARASLQEKQGTAATKDLERRIKGAQFLGQTAGAFLSLPPERLNKATLAPWVSQMTSAGLLSPEVAAYFDQMADDPAQLAQGLQLLQRQAIGAKEQAERQFTSQNLGNRVQLLSTPKYGDGPAQVVPGSQAAVGMTPYESARIALERQQEARLAAAAAGGGGEEGRVVARTETAADGTVRFYNKFGDLLKTEAGAGKPSAAFEQTKTARANMQRDLAEVTANLREVTKDGGLIDQSTGSGIGRAGDVVAGFVGRATPGAIAIGKLQPLADQVLKLVPRFEGPQSDKDTQSYREAAGQLADPTLPTAIRKEAGKTILRLYERRQGQFTREGAATDNSVFAEADAIIGR